MLHLIAIVSLWTQSYIMFSSEEHAAMVVSWSSILRCCILCLFDKKIYGVVFGVIHYGEDRGSAYEVALSMGTL